MTVGAAFRLGPTGHLRVHADAIDQLLQPVTTTNERSITVNHGIPGVVSPDYMPGPSVDELRRAQLQQARQAWRELERDDVERHGRYYVDNSSGGRLLEPVHGVIFDRSNIVTKALVAAFYVAENGELVVLQAPRSGPRYLHQLLDAERDRKRAQQQAELERRERLASSPLRPLQLDELERRQGQLPTLRRAAETLEHHGVKLEAGPHGLLVLIPERLPEGAKLDVIAAAKVVLAASSVVLDALDQSGRSDEQLSARLPDRQVAAGGGLA